MIQHLTTWFIFTIKLIKFSRIEMVLCFCPRLAPAAHSLAPLVLVRRARVTEDEAALPAVMPPAEQCEPHVALVAPLSRIILLPWYTSYTRSSLASRIRSEVLWSTDSQCCRFNNPLHLFLLRWSPNQADLLVSHLSQTENRLIVNIHLR